jgi:hypothetical protein
MDGLTTAVFPISNRDDEASSVQKESSLKGRSEALMATSYSY